MADPSGVFISSIAGRPIVAVTTDGGAEPVAGSPLWWVQRLSRRLDYRLGRVAINGVAPPSIDRWRSYYNGDLNLALQSEKWRDEFAKRFPGYTANLMQLVVDKHRERLQVHGIRYGDKPGSDDDAWRWWQDNQMDAESLKLHREHLVVGSSYVLVWPNAEGVPEISIESANQVAVETVPGKASQRAAALKRYLGDDLHMYAELYLPDGMYRFRSRQRDSDFSVFEWTQRAVWEPFRRDGEEWPVPIPFGVVPIVPFVHKPDLFAEGSSKLRPVASTQDAVNKYRVDAFVASEFASFRQRWAIGLDIPVDPDTGQPVEPFKAAVDRLWTVSAPDPADWPLGKVPQVQFGEFDVTPLDPFYKAIEGEVRLMATISKTPYHQVLPQSGQPPSGDSLRAAESGLVAEVVDSQVNLGESYEEVFRLNFLWRSDARADQPGAEVIWRDPEVQSEGEHIDALMKMKAMGVPQEALWERMHGVTQQTIKRWKRMAAQEALETAVRTPEPPSVPAPTPTAQVTSGDEPVV